jgi:ribosomal-protein-alanine N-acetyltransferase
MLTTQRLVLRPMKIEDASHLFELNLDPEVVRYTGDTSCASISDALKIITDLSHPQFKNYKMGRFSVLLHDGTYLGWCGLKIHPDYDNEVDLGYRFHRRFWGMGYATEASLACLKYGFEELGLTRIVAKVMPANVGSIKVVQKLGMTFRGLGTNPTDPTGLIVYDIKAEEFKK